MKTDMRMELWPIENLHPAEYNPRVHLQPGDPEYESIARSIETFGYADPIIVNTDGTIIGGHQRFTVLSDLGYKEVHAVVVDLTKDKEKALNIALNKISGAWDEEKLKALLQDIDLSGLDMTLTGFTAAEYEDLRVSLEGNIEPQEDADFDADAAYETAAEPVTRRGDIWILGEHRLMCGDSTDAADVSALMAGNRADICFTSPPYNVGTMNHGDKINDNRGPSGRAYILYDDNLPDGEYANMLDSALNNALDYCDDVLFNIGMTAGSVHGVADFVGRNSGNFAYMIAWVKYNAMPPTLSGLHGFMKNIFEPIFCFNVGGSRKFHHPQWPKNSPVPNVIETENGSQNKVTDHHATFPVKFAGDVISKLTDDSVIDLFGGSGTTLIAAEQLGRRAYMMELDPRFCDVIIRRWEEYTCRTAKREE